MTAVLDVPVGFIQPNTTDWSRIIRASRVSPLTSEEVRCVWQLVIPFVQMDGEWRKRACAITRWQSQHQGAWEEMIELAEELVGIIARRPQKSEPLLD